MTAPATFAEAVAAVPHHERCNVWAGKSLTMLPVIELASGRIPCEPSCTCDRDARIAKGIEDTEYLAFVNGMRFQASGERHHGREATRAERLAAFVEASRA